MERSEGKTLLKSLKDFMEPFGVSFRGIFHFSLLLFHSLWDQESRGSVPKVGSTCQELRLCFVKSLTGGPGGSGGGGGRDIGVGSRAEHMALIGWDKLTSKGSTPATS